MCCWTGSDVNFVVSRPMGSYQLLADTLMTNFLVVKELRYVLKRYFSNYFPFLFAVDVEKDRRMVKLPASSIQI